MKFDDLIDNGILTETQHLRHKIYSVRSGVRLLCNGIAVDDIVYDIGKEEYIGHYSDSPGCQYISKDNNFRVVLPESSNDIFSTYRVAARELEDFFLSQGMNLKRNSIVYLPRNSVLTQSSRSNDTLVFIDDLNERTEIPFDDPKKVFLVIHTNAFVMNDFLTMQNLRERNILLKDVANKFDVHPSYEVYYHFNYPRNVFPVISIVEEENCIVVFYESPGSHRISTTSADKDTKRFTAKLK